MKPFYKSKAMWGVIVLIATFLAQMFGIETGEDPATTMTKVGDFLNLHGMEVGAALGIWGIRTAKKDVTLNKSEG